MCLISYDFGDGRSIPVSPRYRQDVAAFLDFLYLRGWRVVMDHRAFAMLERQHGVSRRAANAIIDALVRAGTLTYTPTGRDTGIVAVAREVHRDGR